MKQATRPLTRYSESSATKPYAWRKQARHTPKHLDFLQRAGKTRFIREILQSVPVEEAMARETGRLFDVLDAGCGTGLCGPLLRTRAKRMTGVDLSPKMIEWAAERGIYDRLAAEELTTFLELACAETAIRLEANRRVPGELLVFRRR